MILEFIVAFIGIIVIIQLSKKVGYKKGFREGRIRGYREGRIDGTTFIYGNASSPSQPGASLAPSKPSKKVVSKKKNK